VNNGSSKAKAWHVKQEQRTRVKSLNSGTSNVRRREASNSGQIAVATPTHTPKHIMWPSLIAGLALLASQAQALYFYIDGPSQKCFFEELPKDTLVVGMQQPTTWLYQDILLIRYRPLHSNTMERASKSLPP
jgi:hypothetical protein